MRLTAFTLGLTALLGLAACGKDATTCGHCQAGSNYCRDPGGNGADLCCTSAAPYYCASDNQCHGDPFFSCPTGKIFCSSENNC